MTFREEFCFLRGRVKQAVSLSLFVAFVSRIQPAPSLVSVRTTRVGGYSRRNQLGSVEVGGGSGGTRRLAAKSSSRKWRRGPVWFVVLRYSLFAAEGGEERPRREDCDTVD